jgi:hypothetical protein
MYFKDVLIELLLKYFIRIIDAKLFKTIDFKVFEAIDIENTNELIVLGNISRTY